MTIEHFIQVLEQTLELPTGLATADTRLVDLPNFDSMGRLSVMSLADAKFGVQLEAHQLNSCETVADLHAVLTQPKD